NRVRFVAHGQFVSELHNDHRRHRRDGAGGKCAPTATRSYQWLAAPRSLRSGALAPAGALRSEDCASPPTHIRISAETRRGMRVAVRIAAAAIAPRAAPRRGSAAPPPAATLRRVACRRSRSAAEEEAAD